ESMSTKIPVHAIYGLLGSNGAGKTTFLSVLAQLTRPTYGSVMIGGMHIDKLPPHRKKEIALVPQDARLPAERTALDYLIYIGILKGMPKKEAHMQSVSLLHTFGLEQVMQRHLKEYSNGMRKLVNIAQAFLGSPKIVLLDEPITGLDPKMAVKVERFLLEHQKGKTYILCSHHISVIERICTHVGILHEGHLVLDKHIRTLQDKEHVLNIRVDQIKKGILGHIRKIKSVREVFLNESENEMRVIQDSEAMHRVLTLLDKENVRVEAVRRGESLRDFFLKYL
ncbi:MAG: ABC transporter ATP-binding protein, partial [Nanoarchaeota archaeon]